MKIFIVLSVILALAAAAPRPQFAGGPYGFGNTPVKHHHRPGGHYGGFGRPGPNFGTFHPEYSLYGGNSIANANANAVANAEGHGGFPGGNGNADATAKAVTNSADFGGSATFPLWGK